MKRDRPDLIEQFNIPIDEYIRRCEMQTAGWELMKDKLEQLLSGEIPMQDIVQQLQAAAGPQGGAIVEDHKELLKELFSLTLSGEYGSLIIHSMESGTPRIIYGNVPNYGLIDNLPKECVVEVPCHVDKNGIQPIQIGPIPSHLTALMMTNINVQAMTVEAALTQERQRIYHAAMLDPHTAAELDLDQIWNLVDELIEAHGDWLPEYY
jgi:alpha-galactosidase